MLVTPRILPKKKMISRYHDSITGKFVTKEYAEENPDTTVKIEHTYIKPILMGLLDYIEENHLPLNEVTVDEYLDGEER